MPFLRLDKYISDASSASRREIKQMIKDGRVAVDGQTAVVPEQKVDPDSSVVTLDGKTVRYERFHYFMLNKPAGLLSATSDGRQKTVTDLFPPELKDRLFPVGRLDKDTTGLLLVTDDGDFAHKVISPKSGIIKVYHAVTEKPVDETDIKTFAEGVVLADGTRCLPAELKALPDGTCLVMVCEGKYHQVKRMLASRSKPVVKLDRIKIGELELDKSLAPGEYRALSNDELCRVMKKK